MSAHRLEDGLVTALLAQVRGHEPGATAVLIRGSHARETASPSSDLDLHAITTAAVTRYRTWFAPRPGQTPLHVSLGAGSAERWLASADRPASWSLGFPALSTAVYLWSDTATRQLLGGDPSQHHPPGEPELEDFVESVLKTKRAAARSDPCGVSWAAQQAGRYALSLLIPLNPPRVVHDRRDALSAALSLPTAPTHFTEQLTITLGLSTAGPGAVHTTTAKLATDLLAFLRERAPDVDSQPELARYLRDGTLERHVEQLS